MNTLSAVELETKPLREQFKRWQNAPDAHLLWRSDLIVLKQPPGIRNRFRRRLSHWFMKLGIHHKDWGRYDWSATLKHQSLEHGETDNPLMTVLVWAVGHSRSDVRQGCERLNQYFRSQKIVVVPVLVTDVPDFAWYSRLSWLIEYLPKLTTIDESYTDRKSAHLAWLYHDASIIPLSAAFLNEEDWQKFFYSNI
ncbi:hypothetical protein [Orrella sp. 11846]|uniref:hypothetical protein n=1 Tax=Orrella sp. 11846 TaxID=3409913 RepID=UPI003B591CFD